MHHQPMRVHLKLIARGTDDGDHHRVQDMLRLQQTQELPAFLSSFLVRPSSKRAIVKKPSGSRQNNEPRFCWFPALTSVEISKFARYVVCWLAIAEQLNRSSGAFSGRRQVGAFDHKKRGPKVRNIESVGLVELVLRKARVSRPRVHSASAIATTNRRTRRLGTLSLYCSHRGHRAMGRRLPCFFPATAAAHIGWQASPFQFEVGARRTSRSG